MGGGAPRPVRLEETDVLKGLYSSPIVGVASTRRAERNGFSAAGFLEEKVAQRPKAIVSWEGHIFDAKLAISDLPDAACLKELGYSKITFVPEGSLFVGLVTLRMSDPSTIGPFGANGPIRNLEKTVPEAYALIRSGEAEPFIARSRIQRRLAALEGQGIRVDVLGLELSSTISRPEIEALLTWWSNPHRPGADATLNAQFPIPRRRSTEQ